MDRSSKTRSDAMERLQSAREEQQRRAEEHDAVRGLPDELSARTDLKEAEEQLAASQAWLLWTERDY